MIRHLFLLGLPASGKSEIRRFLEHLDADVGADLGLGALVHLDDFPYVHLMRRIDDELEARGEARRFFIAADDTFRDPRDWLTLSILLDEDVARIDDPDSSSTEPVGWVLARLDEAAGRVGIPPRCEGLPTPVVAGVADVAEALAAERSAAPPPRTRTVLVEFARGGPEGARPPLPEPLGYRASLARFRPETLRRAGLLYVWVTPEEARRRNRERARPGEEGSVLHHGVPEPVMRRDYGTDDFCWLLSTGGGGHVPVDTAEGRLLVPAAVFDNRRDRTSFARGDPARWPDAAVADLEDGLAEALARLR
ncbi:MAG TPA: hypothetical protein ENK55_10030 [Actinobacteria bacterium]|nr:hypothetical protein [Actinomycetota bacterium]